MVVDGYCASACTISLGVNDVCATDRAVFAFHQVSFDFDENRPAPEGTSWMFSIYPVPIQEWITANGGLTRKVIELRGAEMRKLVRRC